METVKGVASSTRPSPFQRKGCNYNRWSKRRRLQYSSGCSTVRLFHQHGATVVIADVQDDLGRALANNLGENTCYIHGDVRSEEEISDLVDTTVSKFGRLDIMYNNAGVLDRPFGGILDTTKQDIEKVAGVNMVGSLLGAKHAARVMVPQRQGCILFTASISAMIGGLVTPAYVMTKAGVIALVKYLAAELGEFGIRVNSVSPGGVVTPLIAPTQADEEKVEKLAQMAGNLKGTNLKAEDVAKAVLYLASDEANYVSGVNLAVDGGYTVVNPSLKNAMRSLLP